jgi:hypothetical protein
MTKPKKHGDVDELTLVPAHREGGRSQAARSYLDFAVNRRPLSKLIDARDHIAVFGWLDRAREKSFAMQLLLRTASEIVSGHAPIYICPECADLGCGAITVCVTFRDDCVVWSDLGWDDVHARASPYAPAPKKRLFDDVRDFWFDRDAYVATLSRFL